MPSSPGSAPAPALLWCDQRTEAQCAEIHRLVGLDRLKAHGVSFNILCTVNAANQHRGLEVYRFFRDTLGCPDALYLDGSISAYATPERDTQFADFAGLWAVTR